MNEVDFLRGIEGEEQNSTDLVSGAEHLVRLKIQSGQQTEQKYEDLELKKEAGSSKSKVAAAQTLKAALQEKVASGDWNKKMLALLTGAGAAAGGVGTYLSSRPQADTGKSKMEEELGAAVEANKMNPERGFLEKLKNRETESAHGFARVFREHPVKASLLGAVTGAASGYGLGQLGGAVARRVGGK